MLPEQPISYPQFVADQLLTAKDLNDLFHYLDVQERGTRINLIGIGIVCGLELKVNSAGTEVTITKGCGITSQGYLVRWDEATFQNYKAYDAAKEVVCPPFYGGGAQKFPIDELKSNSSEEGITKLTKTYLEDKVALLFVELLLTDAKNCDPESCDDKGSNITLTIRPLLVARKDAVYLTGGVAGTNSFNQGWISLPELKMPRHHVPAADIFDSGDVFDGFQKVLSAAFLGNLEKSLTQTYTRLLPLVQDIYATNPFAGMAGSYAFVHDGTITVQQLLYMQYYYDLFSDMIYAYEELRRSGMRLLSLCYPDENLFPRHLLLGATGSSSLSNVKLDFRHYFIPSPALCCHGGLVNEVRMLFKRLVLLLQKFVFANRPVSALTNATLAGSALAVNTVSVLNRATALPPIRITPSKLGDVPLSEKAIPFYYDVASGADKLFQHWSYERSIRGTADHNLSYNASQYNTTDDDVRQPLHYDLEPHNFLRIEGHVGHNYVEALATINQIRDTNRLPFDVVALSADIKTLREMLAAIANSTNYANLREGFPTDISVGCHFQDLEALYDSLAEGFLCNLCKEMKYYYSIPTLRDAVADKVPLVPLLKKFDPAFRYRLGSLGDRFEQFYKTVATQPYITPDQFLNSTAFNNNTAVVNNTFSPFLALMYYIEKLSEVLPVTLINFNIVAFQRRYTDLLIIAQYIKNQIATTGDNSSELAALEDLSDHLDALLYACRDAQFLAVYNDYKVRWVYLAMLQKLGYYVKMHPGIQHKAGVTVGGTFIIVYHERSRLRQGNVNIFTNRATVVTAANTVKTAEAGASGAGAADNKTAKETKESKSKAKKDASSEDAATQDADTAGAATLDAGNLAAAANAYVADKSIRQIQTSKLTTSLTQKQFAIIDKLFFKDLITKHSLDELTAQLPDRIVIADFYLPYMCCSDCPPVYFIVNEKEEDPAVPTISIKDLQYCNADKAAYPITVTPTGGTAAGEGVTTANGVVTFSPSAVNIPEGSLNEIVALTYTTTDGQIASVNVTVFAKPTAAFDIIPATTYNFFVFANKSLKAASVAWDFGDGITGTGDNPSHLYGQDGTYVVSLKAVNGVCSDTITKTINIEKASIFIDGKDFCSADKSAYPIQINPEGGNVTGEGTAKETSGFVFRPANIAFAAADASKDVTMSYSVTGQSAQTSVKVFRTPSAAFTVKDIAGAAANAKLFQTANTFAAQYSWNFGDGEKSVEANPTHQYKQGGKYTITLDVTNGPCTARSTQDITITTDTTKTCGPLTDIITTFKNLNKVNAAQFKIFTAIYAPYPDIENYFNKLSGIAGTTVADQIVFFSDSDVAALLDKWFSVLNPLVQSSDVRQMAIAMWRVLTDLTMYVMCIQDGDFDKNRINLGALFNKLESFIKGWAEFAANFSAVDKAQLQLLLNDITAERDRVVKNGEDPVKKTYLLKLNSSITMLTSYLK